MDMIERVARALCKADGKNPDAPCKIATCGGDVEMLEWQYHYPFASKRVIEEMLEPTEEMVEAGSNGRKPGNSKWGNTTKTWSAMIRAALEEGK